MNQHNEDTRKWFTHSQGKQEGPFTLAEVRQMLAAGKLDVESFAWCDGMQGWDPIKNIAAFQQASPPPKARPAPAPAPAPSPAPAQSFSTHLPRSAAPSGGRALSPASNKHNSDLSFIMEMAKAPPAPEDASNTGLTTEAKQEVAAAIRASRKGARAAGEGISVGRIVGLLLIAAALAAAAFFFLNLTAPQEGHAAEQVPPLSSMGTNPTPPRPTTPAERMNVDKLKEKYWTSPEESEVRVVQNRYYTRSRKFEFGLLAGTIATDPFLSVHNVGGTLSYHVNEYFALSALGWKSFVVPSSALETLEKENNTTANTNEPKNFMGGQLAFSPLYGKLSLLGKHIIYFDTQLMLGGGVTGTENGSLPTPFVGIGGQFYLSRVVTLRIDYRMMGYNELLRNKNATSGEIGRELGKRLNLSDVITLGITFLAGPI